MQFGLNYGSDWMELGVVLLTMTDECVISLGKSGERGPLLQVNPTRCLARN